MGVVLHESSDQNETNITMKSVLTRKAEQKGLLMNFMGLG
jgi:hypothetical protein